MENASTKTLGVIVGVHGLRGDVVIKPWDSQAAWADSVRHVNLVNLRKPGLPVSADIQYTRWQGQKLVLKFKHITNRNEAEALRGIEIHASAADLPELQEDEFYFDDLEGFLAKSEATGHVLGQVESVLTSEAGDFLEITADTLSESVLIPFQDSFIPVIDREKRELFISKLDSMFQVEDSSGIA